MFILSQYPDLYSLKFIKLLANAGWVIGCLQLGSQKPTEMTVQGVICLYHVPGRVQLYATDVHCTTELQRKFIEDFGRALLTLFPLSWCQFGMLRGIGLIQVSPINGLGFTEN